MLFNFCCLTLRCYVPGGNRIAILFGLHIQRVAWNSFAANTQHAWHNSGWLPTDFM